LRDSLLHTIYIVTAVARAWERERERERVSGRGERAPLLERRAKRTTRFPLDRVYPVTRVLTLCRSGTKLTTGLKSLIPTECMSQPVAGARKSSWLASFTPSALIRVHAYKYARFTRHVEVVKCWSRPDVISRKTNELSLEYWIVSNRSSVVNRDFFPVRNYSIFFAFVLRDTLNND